MCAADLRPFNMFQTDAYKRYMKLVQPSYTPPSANTVKKYLQMKYKEEKMNVVTRLKSDCTFMGLTSDLWTSVASKGFLTITGHYIDPEWNLQHLVLSTRQVTGSHDHESILQKWYETEKDFGISEKVVSMTSDNASNMKAAARKHECKTNFEGGISCFAHTLQLAVHEGLDQPLLKETTAICRKLVGHFNMSSQASDALKEYQKNQKAEKILRIIQDVPTRWNSTYFMLKRLQELRTVVYALLHDPKIIKPAHCQNFEITDAQWQIIEDIIPVLEPFVTATEALSSEAYPSASCVLPMLLRLIQNNLTAKPSDPEIVKTFKFKTRSGLSQRFILPSQPNFSSSILATATFLDPRHKKMSFIDEGDIKAEVRNNISLVLRSEEPETSANPCTSSDSLDESKNEVFSYMYGDIDIAEESVSSIEDEISSYIHEPVMKWVAKAPLKWWKMNEHRFRRLAKLAKRYLCIMATSVPSERVFSVAGLTVTKTRAKLDPALVDEIIFLNKLYHQRCLKEHDNTIKQVDKCDISFTSVKQELPCQPSTPTELVNITDNEEEHELPSLY